MKSKSTAKIVVALLPVFILSCSRKTERQGSFVVAGSPMSPSIHFQFAVYMLPKVAKEPQSALREALKDYPTLKLVDGIPDNPSEAVVSARIQKDVATEYAPPSVEDLAYFGHGLSKKQANDLQESKQAFILDFAHPSEKVWLGLHSADLIMERLARETGGLIWDQETREVFTPDAWNERRLSKWTAEIPSIQSQTAVHVYQKDEFVRAITLGMDKAGLPDVVVEGFDRSSENQVGNLINIFSQAIAEGATVKVPGSFTIDLKSIKDANVREKQMKSLGPNATGVGYLQLKQGSPDEGDPKNRLVELAFGPYDGSDPQAKRDRMISCFFGAHDETTRIEHTEELLETSRKAKTQLPGLYEKFNFGLPPGELILVKAPFKTPSGGNEWMWVEITHWKNKRIRGVLENDPELVPDLHSGQIVEIREEDVFDYIHKYADGRNEGNTTGEVIRRMEKLPKPNAPTPSVNDLVRRISDSGCSPK